MLKRRVVILICLVVTVAGFILLRSPANVDTAQASSFIRFSCIGESFVIHNPTDETLAYSYRFHTAAGAQLGSDISSLLGHRTASFTDVNSASTNVGLIKGLRVVGSSGAATGSQGFSECVKTKSIF